MNDEVKGLLERRIEVWRDVLKENPDCIATAARLTEAKAILTTMECINE